ncbi:NAD-dependent epimerase/dehydratase family protein [Pseudomonas typographi]|uniref:NAD-dependent epimerase/dehydratase family protein n=1 Tax=Pseudomonas typographi TaxID=2715964 RepID=A0ABR7YVC3_9PSED|nr:NAD-dependent epimerase/dehydratase family protein [Pseudomonas typographi]MBD1597146.1 NAD-dependent epimerase/dehydratase family protein [Pseudomonas typographi]
MKTLITGCSGFVGLALAELLLAKGEDVVGFDISPIPPAALAIFAALPGRFSEEQGDVRNATALRRVMSESRPQRVVTLAAITADARRERLTPQAIFDVNVGGVLAAIGTAADCGVSRLLHISSGSVYGATGREPAMLDEANSPLAPEGLYGMSKRAAEEAALRLASLCGLALAIGRLGTCFGPWEADSGLRDTLSAPLQLLEAARRGGTAVLPGDSQRDWLYVRDAAQAIACLLEHEHWNFPIYNLAAGFEWRLGQWCERLEARHPGFRWRLAAPGEAASIDMYADYDRASMNIQRLRDDTGFVPRFDLAAADHDFHHWLACTAGIEQKVQQ